MACARNAEVMAHSWSAWLLAAVVAAASTVVFNVEVLRHLDERRAVDPAVMAHNPSINKKDTDTPEFFRLLEISASSLRQWRVFVPTGDFDCPLDYLVLGGLAMNLTGWEPLPVHNLFFLVVFFLNGFCAFAFLQSLLRHISLALAGSVVYQTCNYAFSAHFIGHMHSVQMQWIPLVFWAVYGMLRTQSGWGWRWVLLLGVCMGLQVMSSPYYTLFLSFVALPVFTLVYLAASFRAGALAGRDLARFGVRLILSALLAGLVSGVYLLPRFGTLPVVYGPPTWRASALAHYLDLLNPNHHALFVGLPVLALSVLAYRWWWLQARPLTSAIAVTSVVGLLMMLPAIPGTPYWFFYHVAPLATRLRVPMRFFPIFYLMLLTLNALYLDDVFQRLSPWRKVALVTILLLTMLAFDWVTSPWALAFDLASTVKTWLKQP